MNTARAAVYLAANPVEAEIVKDYLAQAGIAVQVRGAYAWAGTGELPFAETYPRLYLDDERDRARARELIERYESGADARRQWRCTGCGEFCPGSFELCWNCNTERP